MLDFTLNAPSSAQGKSGTQLGSKPRSSRPRTPDAEQQMRFCCRI